MKENKKRILFWFVVMVVFFILGISGKNNYKNGYGTYGKLKVILEPIVVEFNTLDSVKKLTDVRADVSKDQIIVTYINTDGKKEKYKFDYINENGVEYIENKDEYGTNTWTFIAQEMSNAVYHLNGGHGSIFTLYSTETFAKTSLAEGLIYKDVSKEVQINIKTNIVKNITGKYASLMDDIYIHDEDVANLESELATNGFFKYSNKDITAYVKSYRTGYEIYITLNDDNAKRAYLSLGNIVKVINPSIYETIKTEDGSLTFDDTSSAYTTQNGIVFSEAGIFDPDQNIFQMIIFK